MRRVLACWHAMRRLVLIALFLIPGVALAGSPQRPLGSYNDPSAVRHDVRRGRALVDAPLIYLSGSRGSERYMVERMSSVPGWYPVDARIILQFRRGRLTGWRRDWQMRPSWF